ncbi:MAG: hypothetical protein MRZ66_04065 [Clostridiales bacterium]|nr:hypothetical protein [Clostridiales bacterium]
MKKFNEYADAVMEFAEPYAKKTSQFFSDTKDAVEDKYYRQKKKYIRKRRINKIKKALEGTLGIILVMLTLFVGILAVAQGVRKFLSSDRLHKAHQNNENENRNKKVVSKPKAKKKNDDNTGYITL